MNAIGSIAMILMIGLGLVMIFAPNLLIREDKRDDPQSVSMTRKAGIAFIAFVIFAGLKIMKYTSR